METLVIDTVVENNLVHIPAAFNNKRVKVIVVDLEAKEKKKKAAAKK